MKQKNKRWTRSQIVGAAIGIAACVILLPLLIVNLILIVKSFVSADEVPSIGGITPMIVLTDSMDPEIKSGDLIFTKAVDPESVEVGDIITFFDPDGNGTSTVTHRVVEVLREDGLQFRTKGDANNTEDRTPVPAENLIGVYRMRLPGLGQVAMFMQTTPGLLVCVVVPLVLLIGIDLLRRRRMEKEQSSDREDLLAQLEALKTQIAAGADGGAGAANAPNQTANGAQADAAAAANRTANAQADTADEPNYTADVRANEADKPNHTSDVRANEADKPNHTSDVQADHTADVQSNPASADTAGTPAGSAK